MEVRDKKAGDELRATLIEMIRLEFGDYAASLYEDFYNDQPLEQIFISANELFSEMMGEIKAEQKLKAVWKKFNIKHEE